jgi:integrase
MTRDERGTPVHESERARVLSQTLGEMWRLAAEMERLETRESVEMRNAEDLRDEERGIAFNEASRKVRLDEEALRFPAGLGYEAKERLIRATIPEIDRRLRHTAGTRLADSGADAFTIKEIPGHGSIQTSARYVHAIDEGKGERWKRSPLIPLKKFVTRLSQTKKGVAHVAGDTRKQ